MEVSLDVGFDAVTDHRDGVEDTVWITDSANDWLTRHKDERWFLMVNYNGPHLPYLPPKAVMAELGPKIEGVDGYSKPYLGEIAYTDGYVARLLAHLDALGLAQDTVVVLTADHGEVMDKRHQCYADNWDSNCLHNHGKTLFDEEVHVPLAFRWPGKIGEARKITTPISHIDLGPTLLGLVGAPIDPQLLGRDVSAALLGGPEPEELPILSEARLASGIRFQGLKYIVHDQTERIKFDSRALYDRRRTKEELYDLVRDPEEHQSLVYGDVACGGPGSARPDAKTCEALLDEMRQRYKAIRADLAARRGAFAMNAAPETLRADDGEPEPSEGPDPGTEAIPEVTPEVLGASSDVGFRPGPAPSPSPPPRVTGAAAESVTSPGAIAWIHLRFSTKARVKGTVRFSLPLRGIEGVTGAAPPPASNQAVVVDLTGPAEWRLGLDAAATVTLELTVEGQPLRRDTLYLGAYGLCLRDPPFAFAVAGLAAFEAPRPGPPLVDTIAPGVFLWADAGAAGLAGPKAEGAEDIDAEVRDMMKEWGYTTK